MTTTSKFEIHWLKLHSHRQEICFCKKQSIKIYAYYFYLNSKWDHHIFSILFFLFFFSCSFLKISIKVKRGFGCGRWLLWSLIYHLQSRYWHKIIKAQTLFLEFPKSKHWMGCNLYFYINFHCDNSLKLNTLKMKNIYLYFCSRNIYSELPVH